MSVRIRAERVRFQKTREIYRPPSFEFKSTITYREQNVLQDEKLVSLLVLCTEGKNLVQDNCECLDEIIVGSQFGSQSELFIEFITFTFERFNY